MKTTEDTEFTERKYSLLFSVFSILGGKDLMEDREWMRLVRG